MIVERCERSAARVSFLRLVAAALISKAGYHVGLLKAVIQKFRRPAEIPLGARGEQFAAKFLKKKGYRIIVMNRRQGNGEIDLIAMDGEFLVFVEVRTRTSEEFMTPEQTFRAEKRRNILRTVRRLIRRHWQTVLRPRIDFIAIIWPEGAEEPASVRHHEAVIPVYPW